MIKAAVQLAILILSFFGSWAALSQVDWVSIFKIEQAATTTEEKLGKLYWNVFSSTEDEVYSRKLKDSIQVFIDHICEANQLDNSKIKLRILDKDEVNAFTLPDDYLVIFTGLLENCENEAELCGVIGHEIAHMEKNHIMKKLTKEVGLSVLISITAGKGGGEIIRQTAEKLSSSAFDRDMEREADLAAVDYLTNAGIDPESFADFLFRLSDEDIPGAFYWISTHPDSKERAEYIIEYAKGKNQ